MNIPHDQRFGRQTSGMSRHRKRLKLFSGKHFIKASQLENSLRLETSISALSAVAAMTLNPLHICCSTAPTLHRYGHLLLSPHQLIHETSPLRWRDGSESESYNLCPRWVSKPALWQRRLYGTSGLQEIIFCSKIATSPQKKPS
ncbi:Uncharacterized protein Rs2_15259 [Raphanus sativus]|nr:Uncharacterized protein Rs2_15259 [Raphanus sativus]